MQTGTPLPFPVDGHYSQPRHHPRYLFTVPITVGRLSATGLNHSRGLTLEISEGGLSAVVCNPPKEGETVALNLHLPDGPLDTLAIVRHSSKTHCGFEFVDPAPITRERIVFTEQNLPLHQGRLFEA